jgi:hypothetical protein
MVEFDWYVCSNTVSFMYGIVNLSLMTVIFSRQNISVMRYSGCGRNSL